jgi:hypothetical protein
MASKPRYFALAAPSLQSSARLTSYKGIRQAELTTVRSLTAIWKLQTSVKGVDLEGVSEVAWTSIAGQFF